MNELDLQKEIKNSLNAIGHRCYQVDSGKKLTYKTRGQGLEKGFPDLFGGRKEDGKLFFVEVKLDKGRLSEHQIKFLLSAQENNMLCGVARSVKEAVDILKGIKKATDDVQIQKYINDKGINKNA